MVGEGARLPFAERAFDAAVIARVLYLVANWRVVLQEVYDALKPGGYLLHEWGNGSYTWSVPKPVQDQCLPLLGRWCEQTFDMEQSFPMPKELRWTVYRKRHSSR